MKNVDYLIVGQGIAGTLLAYFLLKKGKKVHVADEVRSSSSTRVAAGIMNPVTGKRFVKTWMADEIFHFARTCYSDLEQELHEKFYFQMPVFRIFSSQQEKDNWIDKLAQPGYSEYLQNDVSRTASDCIKPFEGFEITGGGFVDMALLTNRFRTMFLNGLFTEAFFESKDMQPDASGIFWNRIHAKRVIFCEGYKSVFNPYFVNIPFVPAKGEVLIIHTEKLRLEEIIIRQIYILPLGNDLYKVGSTNTWDPIDENPTAEGEKQVLNDLKEMIHCDFTIVSHFAGVKPALKDRRPVIGMHPEFPFIGIFNGLGTKGASLAPYFARHFADHLEEGTPLLPEVDFVRFFK